jgi:selenocysteine lyase/cysteine desulfurase
MSSKLQNKSIAGTKWEAYFDKYRENTVGNNTSFKGPYGTKRIIYADWIASGRLYAPIERKMLEEVGPLVANTHTETSYTGKIMTKAYDRAKQVIKQHVNATHDDVLIATGTGMTGAAMKFQRILGLKLPEQFKGKFEIEEHFRPVVFVSHMEHHSNQTSWLETIAELVVIGCTDEGIMDLNHFDQLLEQYADRPYKIACITSCSNVTGIFTPYYEVAKKIHAVDGYCFVDFAASGPYVEINMHPEEKGAHLDAIFYSPHKFLGGPGTPGVLVFNSMLYRNSVPDHPGGGTVLWTDPWGGRYYIEDIETREDGGTPGFLQTIKAAMVMQLKEEMTVEAIQAREKELLSYLFDRFDRIEGLTLLAGHLRDRIGAISFHIKGVHYNFVVQLLNDLFGIQTRGGCSCAGTYGHYLLHMDKESSQKTSTKVVAGDKSQLPGWIRLSVHPTFSDADMIEICDAIEHVALFWQDYEKDYFYEKGSNRFVHLTLPDSGEEIINSWF